jgi:hypothetical protein
VVVTALSTRSLLGLEGRLHGDRCPSGGRHSKSLGLRANPRVTIRLLLERLVARTIDRFRRGCEDRSVALLVGLSGRSPSALAAQRGELAVRVLELAV